MKKFILVCLAIISFNANANQMEAAFDKVAKTIFFSAWPSAEYTGYETFSTNYSERYIDFDMTGISAFSDKELKLRLRIIFNKNFGIEDYKVIKHNAFLFPPFTTTKIVVQALNEAIEESNSGSSSTSYALADTTSNSGYPIHVKNKCDKDIKVAITYKTISGNWKTVGWYGYDAYEAAYPLTNGSKLNTDNQVVYYYAKSNNGHYEWGGDDTYQSVDGKRVGMKKLIDEKGETNINFLCN